MPKRNRQMRIPLDEYLILENIQNDVYIKTGKRISKWDALKIQKKEVKHGFL